MSHHAGRVFSREDLEFIAQLCIEHNVYVLADEGAQLRCISLAPCPYVDRSNACPQCERQQQRCLYAACQSLLAAPLYVYLKAEHSPICSV